MRIVAKPRESYARPFSEIFFCFGFHGSRILLCWKPEIVSRMKDSGGNTHDDFQERLRRREMEQRLTSELQVASEKVRLAPEDSEELRRARESYAVALDRFTQFVGHGTIPSDLGRSKRTSG
jgi:hypothetical protein